MRLTPREIGLAVIVVATLFAAVLVSRGGDDGGASPEPTASEGDDAPGVSSSSSSVGPATAAKWTVEPYRGLGAWVDVFDFDPAYQSPGEDPLVTPADVATMKRYGVKTIYLQAARLDERSLIGLANTRLLAGFLAEADRHDIAVVAWYLPKFADVDADLARLEAIYNFETSDGLGFDGLGVDIEFTEGVPDHAERSQRLIELSERLHAVVGNDVLSAITLPPVLTEVINEDFWPGLPYRELAPLYDVWMPMSYWSFRISTTDYDEGYNYNAESVVRLRDNLGDPDALVHPIGGIGDVVSEAEIREFIRSLIDTRSIGGSIYDFRTMSIGSWAVMSQAFDAEARGDASNLPGPAPLPPDVVANP